MGRGREFPKHRLGVVIENIDMGVGREYPKHRLSGAWHREEGTGSRWVCPLTPEDSLPLRI